MSDVTSLAAYATGIQQDRLRQQVGMAVANKAQDVAKQEGRAVVQMIQAAAEVAAPRPAVRGGRLDVTG